MREPHIRIVDFGVALRAPEVTIGAHWDAKVDIWSLGCLVIEFMQGIVPFSGVAAKKRFVDG
ncbi:Protein kinase-like domain protein [Penicillium malachiteum]|uniref:Protein kinase-like domain protein n=1 Tax=Penicillium malachiteum TaxID=1324776 RepID=UPI002547C0DD|nr:Protein kinase-like domain protein [Penicillium malachiteum]KAJ5715140.1 Protein kinase-like domain protein [Penicillium malachiteum]